MLDFMVLSAPRSGSTWAANWLTTERVMCLHDPVLEHRIEDLDLIPHEQVQLGISCTALALLPDAVNRHRARKVILHRDRLDIDASLVRIGLSALSKRWDGALDKLEGKHVHYSDLFDPRKACQIWQHLTETDFDPFRHGRLARMRVTPFHPRVPVDSDCARDFRHRIERAFS